MNKQRINNKLIQHHPNLEIEHYSVQRINKAKPTLPYGIGQVSGKCRINSEINGENTWFINLPLNIILDQRNNTGIITVNREEIIVSYEQTKN